ncbi:MAG: hypothetical protein JW940_37255 [Polyangiaceae bacterium]|nr:hypothetical protein [Polyangiaceae bacterium]
MHLVAIAELRGTVDAAVGPLASELGILAYELRLVLSAGFPAVILASADEAAAQRAFAAVERLGHAAVACDRRDIVASAAMTTLRAFEFGPEALIAHAGSADRLPYDEIAVLVRAMHRSTTETVEKVKERKFRPGVAIATGGLIMSKKTTREVVTRTDEREQVLYIFRRSGAPPWILRERSALYGGLGADLRPSSFESFAATVARIRTSAPEAAYDERLMNSRPIRGVANGVGAADICAYLIAMHLQSRRP